MRNDTLALRWPTSGIEIPFYRSASSTGRQAGQFDGGGLRCAPRQIGQYCRRLYRGRLRLLGHQNSIRKRLPLAVVPDGADEKSREEIIGVLQLINAKPPVDRRGRALFGLPISSLPKRCPQAAIALTNRLLINHLETLFESFISLINAAITTNPPIPGDIASGCRADHDACRASTIAGSAAQGFHHDDATATNSRSPACCTIAKGDNPGALVDSDQAADPVRPYRTRRHALRGDQARCGTRGIACR